MEVVKKGRLWDRRTFLVDLPRELARTLSGDERPHVKIVEREDKIIINAEIKYQ